MNNFSKNTVINGQIFALLCLQIFLPLQKTILIQFNLASRTWPLGQVLEDMLVETDFTEKFYIIVLYTV